jgi:uncharacterized protein YfkK (UPF0435 family)
MEVTQGIMQKSIVSAVEFLDQREIDPNIYDESRDRAFTDIMKLVKRRKVTSMPTYHNWVNDNVRVKCTVSSVTSGSGTAQVVFVVNTNSGFPRKTDLININNANNEGEGVQGYITAVTYGSGTATITARSVGGNSVPIFVANGNTVSFGSNASGEKSSSLTNRRYSVTKYFNQTQIFREFDEITDVQKVSKVEFTVNGKQLILPYQLIQKVIKLNGDISYQMINGVKSDTLYSDQNPFLQDVTSGLGVQTTGGLNWYVTTYGISDSAATLGTFGFTEWNEIVDNLIANKAPSDYMCFMSNKVKGILDVFHKNLGSSGVTSVRMMIDGKTLDFEVDMITYRNKKFYFMNMPIFDNPDVFSATIEPDVYGSIYFVPTDSVETVDNGRQPRLQIRYMESPFAGSGANISSDGVITEIKTGALAPVPTSGTLALATDWVTNQGLEAIALKHFQKYRVV